MKLLFIFIFLAALAKTAICQPTPAIEVRSFDYVWTRPAGDDRIVYMKDTMYQQIMKRSFIKAMQDKWNIAVGDFPVRVNRLSPFRFEPKFNPSISNADTSKLYLFLQLFDEDIGLNENNSSHSATISVKYRLMRGPSIVEDKTAVFRSIKKALPGNQIRLNRYSFHPSQFQYLCDTIADFVLNREGGTGREIYLKAAYGYADSSARDSMYQCAYSITENGKRISVSGDKGFTIIQDSVNVLRTGKINHRGDNTAGALLTLFSNIDTEKRRSTLYTAHHYFQNGVNTYHCYVSYIDTKVAERRRINHEDDSKSIRVDNYVSGEREINSDVPQVITLNQDTVSLFNITFRPMQEKFSTMWDGEDTASKKTFPVSLNNPAAIEMEMKGVIEGKSFLLKTSNIGSIKYLVIDPKEVFTFYSTNGIDGKIVHSGLDDQKLKVATLLCRLSDLYYQLRH